MFVRLTTDKARVKTESMGNDGLYAALGNLIRARRKEQKLTQEKLAASIGISRASLANIETGRQKVLVHQIYALADALGAPVGDLLPPPDKSVATADLSVKFSREVSAQQKAQLLSLIKDKQ
jgi:transcriptional regulator with XRE-family HTH domain